MVNTKTPEGRPHWEEGRQGINWRGAQAKLWGLIMFYALTW